MVERAREREREGEGKTKRGGRAFVFFPLLNLPPPTSLIFLEFPIEITRKGGGGAGVLGGAGVGASQRKNDAKSLLPLPHLPSLSFSATAPLQVRPPSSSPPPSPCRVHRAAYLPPPFGGRRSRRCRPPRARANVDPVSIASSPPPPFPPPHPTSLPGRSPLRSLAGPCPRPPMRGPVRAQARGAARRASARMPARRAPLR